MSQPAVIVVLVIRIAGVTCISEDRAVTPEQRQFFETNIRPVLAERCMECHDEDHAESDLVLSSRMGMLAGGNFGPALNPGEPSQSLLISAIRHDEFTKRPPKEELSTNDVINLTRWVEMGARCQVIMFITAGRILGGFQHSQASDRPDYAELADRFGVPRVPAVAG